jgi:hypothetical protein
MLDIWEANWKRDRIVLYHFERPPASRFLPMFQAYFIAIFVEQYISDITEKGPSLT